jgi:carbamoyl-phosphate synthase large subunit
MSKIKINIAVTGLNNTDNPGPGIPVIRAIKESEIFEPRIIGLAYEHLEPGIYMKDMVDKIYQIPYPSAGSDALLRRINYINEKEQLNVLIPNFDAELYTFIKYSLPLKEKGISLFLPSLQQFEERHKYNLNEFGKKYDILIPESKSIFTYDDLADIEDEIEFPVVVKGKFYDAFIANDFKQVQVYFQSITSKWGVPVVLQEYVQGNEVNVVALGDGEGNMIGAVPMKKQFITEKGKAWSGITIDDPKLIDMAREIISKTKWRGGMELELVKTKDKKYYLIEINPRIPAWVYLAVGAGQNIPEALVKLAMGMEVKPFTGYKTGIQFIRYSYDLIADLSSLEFLSLTGEN